MNNPVTYPDTIWAVREITATIDELLSGLEYRDAYLPFIRRIGSEVRKREWLTVRVLLKELLGEEKEIVYDTAGRPGFKDGSYHLSISHTTGQVAVIVNPRYPVGIDIERNTSRIFKIRRRFMSPEEESGIVQEQEQTHLLLHWSAKETLFKVIGKENIDFRENLHIQSFTPEIGLLGTFEAYETATSFKQKFLIRYIANSEYVLTFTES